MKFKYSLILLFLLIYNQINSQYILNNYNFKIDKIINLEISDSIFTLLNSEKKIILYDIPVKFRIIRKDKKDIKINSVYLKELIQYLNYYYSINNTGIRFSLRPDFEYVDNNKLLNLRYCLQVPFQAAKMKSKACINVIIVNKIIKKKILSSRKKNFAGTFNPFSKTVIISRNISTSTLSHEIGHYLGLKHPHRGWKYKWFQEPVSRTRKVFLSNKKMCEKKGDGLCDTPAEPNLSKYTDKNCNYTGWNVKDKYGEVYKPSTHNIMSYTNNRECRNKFTKQQIYLMLNTLSKNKYAKYWRADIPENKDFLPDPFEPDNYKETASEIFFNTPQIHSFHKIYTEKKNKFIPDTVDWLFFELKTKRKQNIKISFTKVNNFIPVLEIKIYNKDKIILNKKTNESCTFTLKELHSGIYSIKIRNKSSEHNNNLYKIKIVK